MLKPAPLLTSEGVGGIAVDIVGVIVVKAIGELNRRA
jgi:hypothetical protein